MQLQNQEAEKNAVTESRSWKKCSYRIKKLKKMQLQNQQAEKNAVTESRFKVSCSTILFNKYLISILFI